MRSMESDWLEAALREPPLDLPSAHDGFTERVLLALPPRRPRAALRPIILFAVTFVVSGVCLLVLPGGAYLDQAVLRLILRGPLAPALPLALLMLGALWATVSVAASE